MERKIVVIKAISAVRTKSGREGASLSESKKTMDFWCGNLNSEILEVLDYLAVRAAKAERADVYEQMASNHLANYNSLDKDYKEIVETCQDLNKRIDDLRADIRDLKEELRQEQLTGAKTLVSLHAAEHRLTHMRKFAEAAAKILTPEELLRICTETEW